jgi:hypothetical protein
MLYIPNQMSCQGEKDALEKRIPHFFLGFIRNNTPQNWKNETLKPNILKKGFRKGEGKIMSPSAHDITPAPLAGCLANLDHMLRPGNQVTIVTKHHLDSVKGICTEFQDYKGKLLFRFTIGSSDSNTLKFWEANAPDFAERVGSLKNAFSERYHQCFL